MKKTNIRRLSTFVVIIMLLSITSGTYATNSQFSTVTKETISLLRNDLSADIYGIVCENLEINISEPQTLPDSYAGAYIDENDQLHICVTKGNDTEYKQVIDTISVKSLFAPYMENASTKQAISTQASVQSIVEVVSIHEVKFSYKYLYSLMDALYPVMGKYGIIEAEIDQIDNRLIVSVNESNHTQDIRAYLSNKVKNFVDNSVVIVETNMDLEEMASYAYNGEIVSFMDGYGSIGFNGTFTDYQGNIHYGIVTNAHVAALHDLARDKNQDYIGDCIFYQKGGNVDLAFIEFTTRNNADWTLTNSLLGSTFQKINAIATTNDIIVGRRVVKYGTETEIEYGTITNVSMIATIGTTTYYDLFETSCYVLGGDSGGPVVVNSIGSSTYKLLGITSGGDEDSGYQMKGIKYSNIQTFGISAYIG